MKRRIMLDAGHYGMRNQSPTVKEYYESVRMWKLCDYLADELSDLGFEVLKTREDINKDMPVTERGKSAVDCDMFLSLHSNATGNGNTKTNRVTVYAPYDGINDSHRIGLIIANAIADCMGINDFRVKTRKSEKGDYEYYGVMRGARSVGCPLYYIVEHSFHTNEKSAKWLLDDENLKKLVSCEASAIALCLGISVLLKGDVNQDGALSAADALMIKRAILKTLTLTKEQEALADMNGDGKLDSRDYVALKKKMLN